MNIDIFLNATRNKNLYDRQLFKNAFKEILDSSPKNNNNRNLKSLLLSGIYHNLPDTWMKRIISQSYSIDPNKINVLYKQAMQNYLNGKILLPKLRKYNNSNPSTPSGRLFPEYNHQRSINISNFYKNALLLFGINNIDPRSLSNNERTHLADTFFNFTNNKPIYGFGRLQPKPYLKNIFNTLMNSPKPGQKPLPDDVANIVKKNSI